MSEENLELFRKLAVGIADIACQSDQQRAYIELVDSDGEPSIVFLIRGKHDCDTVRPALDRLCPRRIVRDGQPVAEATK